MRPPTLDGLRLQAELQLHHRRHDEHRIEHLPIEDERGFALMPEPSPGDVWLDLEGHPWFEPARGLEYLFGWVYLEDGEPRYDCIWARDRAAEKAGFERLVDLIVERRRRFPGMHVYHYAAYERTALSRLMGEHGTREGEIDDLLRGEVLVDLYRVVRQSLRASIPSYSIKAVEELYGFERTADVSGGSESVVNFEEWLEAGEDSLLEEIRAYNEEDCRSLYELHQWLLGAAAGRARVARAARGARGQGGDEGAARRARRGPASGSWPATSRSSSSRTSSTTTAARRSRSGGPTSTT